MKNYAVLGIMALLGAALAHEDGMLTMKIDGNDEQVNVVSQDWCSGMISVNDRCVTLSGGGRALISEQNTDSFNPSMFKVFNLEGKTLSYDVNLSNVDCSCNAALYGVTMPGKDWNGNPDPTSGGDYYCDANFDAELCPELDIFEANKYTMAFTPHSCSPATNGHYSDCDHGGCGTNIHDVDAGFMGPGKTIDTNRQFTQKSTFKTTGDGKHMTVQLLQDDRNV